jgi:hypothetical protein
MTSTKVNSELVGIKGQKNQAITNKSRFQQIRQRWEKFITLIACSSFLLLFLYFFFVVFDRLVLLRHSPAATSDDLSSIGKSLKSNFYISTREVFYTHKTNIVLL